MVVMVVLRRRAGRLRGRRRRRRRGRRRWRRRGRRLLLTLLRLTVELLLLRLLGAPACRLVRGAGRHGRGRLLVLDAIGATRQGGRLVAHQGHLAADAHATRGAVRLGMRHHKGTAGSGLLASLAGRARLDMSHLDRLGPLLLLLGPKHSMVIDCPMVAAHEHHCGYVTVLLLMLMGRGRLLLLEVQVLVR